MTSRPIPDSNPDFVVWIAKAMIAIAALMFMGAVLACVYLGIQITTPASASASSISSSSSNLETTLTCGEQSSRALMGFTTSMGIIVAPLAVVGGLLVVGVIYAMMHMARD